MSWAGRSFLSPTEERDTSQQQGPRLSRAPRPRHSSNANGHSSTTNQGSSFASSSLYSYPGGNLHINSSEGSSSSAYSAFAPSSVTAPSNLHRSPTSPIPSHADYHPGYYPQDDLGLYNPNSSPRSAQPSRGQHDVLNLSSPTAASAFPSSSSMPSVSIGDPSNNTLQDGDQASSAAGPAHALPHAMDGATNNATSSMDLPDLIDFHDDDVDAADTLLDLSSRYFNGYDSYISSILSGTLSSHHASLLNRSSSVTSAATTTDGLYNSTPNALLLHGLDFSSSNVSSSAATSGAQPASSTERSLSHDFNASDALSLHNSNQGSTSRRPRYRVRAGHSLLSDPSDISATTSDPRNRNTFSLDLADSNQFPPLPGDIASNTTSLLDFGLADHHNTLMFSAQPTGQKCVENSGLQRELRTMDALRSTVFADSSRAMLAANLKRHLEDLLSKGACAALLYQIKPSPSGSDVWPDIRDITKIPASYQLLQLPQSTISSHLPRYANPPRAQFPRLPTQLPPHEEYLPKLRSSGRGWPKKKLPTELYELVCSYLARDDIKAMRLCCKELEQHVSQTLFDTVVVPFNTGIYDMLKSGGKKRDVKGKGRADADAIDAASIHDGFQWKNEKHDELYEGHGVDVFKGFGPHIRRYGMSFEVDEDALTFPPYKGSLEDHVSYWGAYKWPYQEYHRFADVAGLETTADETPKMKTAFSFLTKTRHLALSLDCGLGWLKGGDIPLRSRILKRSPAVFGPTRPIPDRKIQAGELLWAHIEKAHLRAPDGRSSLLHAQLFRQDLIGPISGYDAFWQNHASEDNLQYFDVGLTSNTNAPQDERQDAKASQERLPALPMERSDEAGPFTAAIPHSEPAQVRSQTVPPSDGLLYTSSIRQDCHGRTTFLIPDNLSKAQKEWLLEIEWAQRAFLSSYMLAIMDNPSIFAKVERLDFSRISSRFVSQLYRTDFWDALPGLKTISIQVIPDWRDVVKDNAGIVDTHEISPSGAVTPFARLLADIIAHRKNIKNLTIGWAEGGEHAEGMFARNQHILPAPIIDPQRVFTGARTGLFMALPFPHVEHLTLTNCWMLPDILRYSIKSHTGCALRKLTLDSVSLTMVPRFGIQNHQPAAIAGPMWTGALALQHLLAQGMQQLQNNLGIPNNNNNAAAPGVGHSHFIQWVPAPAGAPAGGAAPPPPPPIPAPLPQLETANNDYLGPHREGSWPYILDILSPGKNLSHFNSEYSNASNPDFACANNPLLELELISVGYAKLPNSRFDQTALLAPTGHIHGLTPAGVRNSYFLKRASILQPEMMESKDELFGEVVQYMSPNELRCLSVVWGLQEGWSDPKKSEGPEFDGFLPGGTGRVSGVIRASDRPPVYGGNN